MTLRVRAVTADDAVVLGHVRQFFRNYAAWLGVDLSFQNFDAEMASLPGAYAAPTGRLYYADVDGAPTGCVGVRRFSDGVAEMKRLYVEPSQRGHGAGRALALAAIRAARELGYHKLLLDTLPAMRVALKLYRELGFEDAAAYYPTPLEGTIFLALDLDRWSAEQVANERLAHLFDFNRAWAKRMQEIDPQFFTRLSQLQSPEFLWIGCSDSRVPANQIVGLLPGEVFVHRNIANVVVHTDLNCLSVIQFAVEVLRVRHVMVVGHYGCGGVRAALYNERLGLADNWVRHVQDVRDKHEAGLSARAAEDRHDHLCELNVLEQAANICRMNLVRDAWTRGQPLTIHAWIYGLRDGLVRDLGLTVNRAEDLQPKYRAALAALQN